MNEKQILLEKLAYLRLQYAVNASAIQKFELIKSIEETEKRLSEINKNEIILSTLILESSVKNSEKFNQIEDWNYLEKIGDWKINGTDNTIIGKGINQYLLSKGEYGNSVFIINTKLSFRGFEKYENRALDNGNAGIIIGWKEDRKNPRYLNLLLTGKKIIFEWIGARGGDDYRDFEHLDNGREFDIVVDKVYFFSIKVLQNVIDVFIDDEFYYSIERPEFIIGRVGLRPWRTELKCEYFEVRETKI